MSDTRDEKSFWAVWAPGQDWPNLYSSEINARQAAHTKAKSNVGAVVHLMRLTSVGEVEYPAKPRLSGDLLRTA